MQTGAGRLVLGAFWGRCLRCACFPFCDQKSGEVCCVVHAAPRVMLFQMLSAARGAEMVLSLMANLGLVGCC